LHSPLRHPSKLVRTSSGLLRHAPPSP
jgi:hypothetical protein